MKFEKALIYVTIRGSTQWYLDNLDCRGATASVGGRARARVNQRAYETNSETSKNWCVNTSTDILKINRQPVSLWEAHFWYTVIDSREQQVARF